MLMLWPQIQAEVYNVALATEYCLSVALTLKMLDTYVLSHWLFLNLYVHQKLVSSRLM